MPVLSDRGRRRRDRRRRAVTTLGEAARQLEVFSDDVPADYLRRLYGLPQDVPVFSRVDALWKRNRK